jgi:hypothetical protein
MCLFFIWFVLILTLKFPINKYGSENVDLPFDCCQQTTLCIIMHTTTLHDCICIIGKTIAFEIDLHIMAIFIKHFCLYTKHNKGDKIVFEGCLNSYFTINMMTSNIKLIIWTIIQTRKQKKLNLFVHYKRCQIGMGINWWVNLIVAHHRIS